MGSAKKKGKPVAQASYRKAIADLADCEERYQGLLDGLPASSEASLEAAHSALRKEVKHRRESEAELLAAVEAERQRIGQDLHDDLCQRLGATAMMISAIGLRMASQDPQVAAELQKIATLASDSIEACRLLARGLHPVTLTSKGLPAALDELAERMPAGIKFRWPSGRRLALEPDVALHLYRITEEAVGNAVRHGKAARISIELGMLDGVTVLAIEDDGPGFARVAGSDGMGLRNMEYRANVIGAKLVIGPRDGGGGTRIVCTVPRRREQKRAPRGQPGA